MYILEQQQHRRYTNKDLLQRASRMFRLVWVRDIIGKWLRATAKETRRNRTLYSLIQINGAACQLLSVPGCAGTLLFVHLFTLNGCLIQDETPEAYRRDK